MSGHADRFPLSIGPGAGGRAVLTLLVLAVATSVVQAQGTPQRDVPAARPSFQLPRGIGDTTERPAPPVTLIRFDTPAQLDSKQEVENAVDPVLEGLPPPSTPTASDIVPSPPPRLLNEEVRVGGCRSLPGAPVLRPQPFAHEDEGEERTTHATVTRAPVPAAEEEDPWPPAPEVVPAGGRPALGRGLAEGAEQIPYAIQLVPPGPQRLFGQFESEAALRVRLHTEALSGPKPRQISFPPDRATQPGRELLRDWGDLPLIVPPHYVAYKRVFFAQPWTERYGNSLGFIQPFVSAGIFYGEVIAFPLFDHCLPIYQCHSDGWSPYWCPRPVR